MRTLLLLIAVSCAGTGSSRNSFRVFYPDAGTSRLNLQRGVRAQAKPAATCTYEDGRDARWATGGARVVEGELPPGMALEDGAIAGAAAKAGTWHVVVGFTGVTCAGAAMPDQRVSIDIVVR